MTPAVAALLHNPLIWRGDSCDQQSHAGHMMTSAVASVVTSGFAELDRQLPGGGWPKGALIELLHDQQGIGELRLLLPALRQLGRDEAGKSIVLIAPPHVPYAPALAGGGVALTRMLVVDATPDKHRWWAAEQVLRTAGIGAMLFWPVKLSDQHLRRLQLAAQDSGALAFVFAGTARAAQASPSPLRVRLSLIGAQLQVDVFKRRAGVMTRPLLLDLPAAGAPCDLPAPVIVRTGSVALRNDRQQRMVTFKPHYPVGGPSAQIWNRALTHADEVRRGAAPDPRVNKGRGERTPQQPMVSAQ